MEWPCSVSLAVPAYTDLIREVPLWTVDITERLAEVQRISVCGVFCPK